MKNVLITLFLLGISMAQIHAQDKLGVDLKPESQPDVYIDGKKVDYYIFDLIDPSKIENINIIKDKKAAAAYNAPNGVILITTKKATQPTTIVKKNEVTISDDKYPVVIIDGKIADRATLQKLSPDMIESIDVLKGEKAMEKYKSPNGVIIIKTKK